MVTLSEVMQVLLRTQGQITATSPPHGCAVTAGLRSCPALPIPYTPLLTALGSLTRPPCAIPVGTLAQAGSQAPELGAEQRLPPMKTFLHQHCSSAAALRGWDMRTHHHPASAFSQLVPLRQWETNSSAPLSFSEVSSTQPGPAGTWD